MDIQKALMIQKYHPLVGDKGTEEEEIFEYWINKYGLENIFAICSLAYGLGYVQGVRDERAKRRKAKTVNEV